MTRFQKIDTEKSLMLEFEKTLKNLNYKEVDNLNGGDDDFLMIDTFKKEYVWCENGFLPFCSDEEMCDYEYHSNPEKISLKKLVLRRY